ncbi:hypothetical protein OFO93_34585, partial [Escherichia coli]|nr:hypothetical protein [Escherichia coli]
HSESTGLNSKAIFIGKQVHHMLTGILNAEMREFTQCFIYTLIFDGGAKGQRDPFWIYQCTQVLALNITVFLITREGMWKLVN